LTALKRLDLEGTGVTDAGLLDLAKLTELQSLQLANMPQLTGTGIEHLKGLKNLESLSLDGKQFAQAGVESVRQLKHLKRLSLADAPLSDAEIEDLNRLLPDVYVSCEK